MAINPNQEKGLLNLNNKFYIRKSPRLIDKYSEHVSSFEMLQLTHVME
jgi:hypothetical protein